ncbi:lysophospholipid acyltransferase family protein [Thermocrinis albus]|uniref:lysophospholipid acyltransferase family protein n=1 Tax=Thermocrinis albus TaxID=136094 RepID=UPI001FE1F7DD|nr:lysophospholipid acyltransferase family protein [Thermocrinis albus]
MRVIGLERIPPDACIVASNHRSHLDPPVLNAVFPQPLIFLAKEELFRIPLLGKALPHMGALPVRRGSGDLDVLQKALDLLHRGCKVCVFPEGTRAMPGSFLKPKAGVGFLAIKSRKPVLPVYIEGTDRVLPRGRKFPLPGSVIKVVIGQPEVFEEEDSPQGYRKVADTIMERIKALSYA